MNFPRERSPWEQVAPMGRRRSGWWRLRVALPALLALCALLLGVATQRLGAFARSPYPLQTPLRYHESLEDRLLSAMSDLPTPAVASIPVERTFSRGETLLDALGDLGLEPAEAFEAVEAARRHLDVRSLKAGESYLAYMSAGSTLVACDFFLGERGRVRLSRRGGGWESSFHAYERHVRVASVEGRLEGSLIGSLEAAGAPAVLAYKMAEVLQWDVDFTRDLRIGDRFEVLFEEVFLDGRSAGLGEILALRYDNAGRRLEGYRFGEDGGYYDAEGRPLKKMFLRSPMRYTRITSRFSHRRFHPILKRYRPHHGVDYGAPVGTPVRVTANGVVTFAGRNGGAGRMVKVRHPNDYLSAYLHLSRFARGVRSGARVRQGEVIGYVGSSGLSTGPHLDYRVQHRGRWIDPLSIKSVPAEPIPEEQRLEFFVWRDALRASLEDGQPLPDTTELEVLTASQSGPAALEAWQDGEVAGR